jgi:predicted nucleic acid-binding protein
LRASPVGGADLPNSRFVVQRCDGRGTELVEISERVVECRDPTDDMFLELAWNGKADMIISGDEDLLTMTPFRQISILTPASFLNWAPR